MPFEDVLVHEGRTRVVEATGPKVDGLAPVAPALGTPFDCCLFLPLPGAEADRGGRRVKRPTLLVSPEDRAGVEFLLGAKQRVLVTAPELTGPNPVLWEVDGDPQPFGKPGEPIIGSQAILKRVDE